MIPVLSTQATGRTSPRRPPPTSLGLRLWRARWCYVLILPGCVLTAMFSVYPLVMSWYYSAFDWDGFSAQRYFVGLGNYDELIGDRYFWQAFGRSIWFAGIATPVEVMVGLLFAVLLNDTTLRLRAVFRTMIFIPVVTTTAIVGIVMSFVFSAYGGPVNRVLQVTRLRNNPIDFLGDPAIVMWTAIGIFVWKWCGQPMIYWLAGLQTIPRELYEAARLDGATSRQQLLHITVPMLKPFAFVIVGIVLANNLQVFAFLQTLTNGGPFFSSETMELYIFREAFGTEDSSAAQRLGYASAAGVLFGVLLMVFGLFQAVMVRRLRSRPAGR